MTWISFKQEWNPVHTLFLSLTVTTTLFFFQFKFLFCCFNLENI